MLRPAEPGSAMRSAITGILLSVLLGATASARPAGAPVRDPSVVADRHLTFTLAGGGRWTQSRGLSEDTPSLGTYQAGLSSSCFVGFTLTGRVVDRRPRPRGGRVDLPGADLRVHRTGRHAGFRWWTGDREGLFAGIGAVRPMSDGRFLAVVGGLTEASDAPPTSRACVREIRSVAGPIVRTAAASLRLADGPVVVRDDDR